MKPQMNNSLFGGTDGGMDPQHLNTQQFIGSQGQQSEGQQNNLTGAMGSRGHKRPKSNLDGFFKSSKGGPMNSNELP